MVIQSDFVVVFIQNVQVYGQIKCYQGKNGVSLFTYDHYMHSDIKERGWMPNETKNDAAKSHWHDHDEVFQAEVATIPFQRKIILNKIQYHHVPSSLKSLSSGKGVGAWWV